MMADFLYAEINVLGIVLLLLLLNNMNRGGLRKTPTDQKIFSICIAVNILIFIFDMGMWLTDSHTHPLLFAANYLSTTFYYILNPLICFVWLAYTDFKIYESRSGLKNRMRFYAIPMTVSAIMSLASPFTGWLFVIDGQNTYSRGPLFWIMAVAALFYMILSWGLSVNDILKNGWEENKSVNIHLVVFPLGIIAASIIQIMFFGLSIIWACCMLALASIYINIQNGEISTDHLTGLYNRRRLDQHLHRRLNTRKGDQLLFAIMLDLDNFKSINDKYGHLSGDNALIKMAGLLRKFCAGSDDFIARMGGDEFVILGERRELREIENLIDQIYLNTNEYNKGRQLNFDLLPSMGYSVFKKGDTPASFLAAADKEMYRNKEARKLQRSQ